MTEIKIDTDFINLTQLLKLIGAISTGGEVNTFLAKNTIKINGIKCDLKRKKLYNGDFIEISDTQIIKIIK